MKREIKKAFAPAMQIGNKFPSSGAAAAKQTGSEFPAFREVSAKQTVRLSAFTLAEVLIALTIIGVIAAITVPALIQRTNKQEYVTALQKAYSTLSQATNMIIAENGSPKCDDGGWACSAEDIYDMYLRYINTAKACGPKAGCFDQLSSGGYKLLSGGRDFNNWEKQNWQKFIMADNMQIMIAQVYPSCTDDTTCARIFADINGAKGPNTFGRDVFLFRLYGKGFFPAGCNFEQICTKEDGSGQSCTCQVLREGAMNY